MLEKAKTQKFEKFHWKNVSTRSSLNMQGNYQLRKSHILHALQKRTWTTVYQYSCCIGHVPTRVDFENVQPKKMQTTPKEFRDTWLKNKIFLSKKIATSG